MSSIADASRNAVNELKRSHHKIASKQIIKLDKPDIRKLEFIIPRGVETISRLQIVRANIITKESESPKKFHVSMKYSSPENYDTFIDYVDFVINSINDAIIIKGQPFPYFMFPNFTFKFIITTCNSYDIMTENVIMDYDMHAETIIRDREVVSEKTIILSNVCDAPWRYRFRCDQLIKEYPKNADPIIKHNTSFSEFLNSQLCNTKPNVTIYTSGTNTSCDDAIINECLQSIINKIENTPNDFIYKRKIRHQPQIAQKVEQLVKEYKILDVEIKSLEDLINLINTNTDEFDYAINMPLLRAAKPGLEKLNNIIGMVEIKTIMTEWILYFLSGLPKDNNGQFMNIALLGEPGVGKTHLSEILAEIFASLSVTKNGDLVKISITDLVGQVVGQTENKTAEILKKHKGSVILVDEAYSIARSGDSRVCSFGAKSLDIINKFLGENTDTMMIICGYKDLIEKYFFGVNDGLKRRFPWIFEMKGYNETELYQIMENKITKDGYSINFTDEQKMLIIKMIKDNKGSLKHNGGDIANIITKAISLHCRKILSMSKNNKNALSYSTVINGITNYFKKPEPESQEWRYSMYT